MFAFLLTSGLSAQSWIDRWTDDSYLPEAGDWSIGIDATTSLDYFGNLLNSGASAPTPGYVNQFDQTFYGKLMTDGGAWRVRLGLNMHKNVISTEVVDAAMMANSGVEGTVTDKESIGETDIDLWLGKEWRRGPTRLHGVWGAEAGIMMESESTTWEFGNPPGDQNGNVWGVGKIEEKSGMTFGLGLRGFMGVEYFVLPRISIGAEYGWAFLYKLQGAGSSKTTDWELNANTGMYFESEIDTKGNKES